MTAERGVYLRRRTGEIIDLRAVLRRARWVAEYRAVRPFGRESDNLSFKGPLRSLEHRELASRMKELLGSPLTHEESNIGDRRITWIDVQIYNEAPPLVVASMLLPERRR